MDPPSRADPVVGALSEWAGGPLGERAAPHPWWSPARVLLALTGVVLAVGMLGKASCVPTGWAGDGQPYGELCWTELAGVPAASAEQPRHTSYVVGLAERVAGLLPGSTTVATLAVLAVLLAALVLLATALLTRVVPGRPWAAAGWAASPVLAAHWLSWDVVAAVGVVLLLWAWTRGSAVAGVVGAILVAAFALPLLDTRTADVGSVWLLLEQASGEPLSTAVRSVVVGLVLVLACAGAFLLLGRRGRADPVAPARVGLLVVVALLVVAPSAPPEAALLALPLAALVLRRWRDLLVWQSCEIVSWALTGWYLSGALAPTAGGNAGAYWVAILVRVAGLVFLATAAVRDRPSAGDHMVEGGRGETHPDVDLVADEGHARP